MFFVAFHTPHNIFLGRGVCLTDPLDRDLLKYKKELWRLAAQLIELYVPGFTKKYYVVQFAKMSKPEHYVGLHIDKRDIAPQYHLTCGSYSGAYLECFDETQQTSMIFSAPYIMVKIDGRLYHQVRKTNFHGPDFRSSFFDFMMTQLMNVHQCVFLLNIFHEKKKN